MGRRGTRHQAKPNEEVAGTTLDAGALIACDRGDRRMLAVLTRANESGAKLFIPAGALAQAWRNGRRQAQLARLIKSPIVELVPLDTTVARASGQLCGATNTEDAIDASVVLCARAHGGRVVTSDPRDLSRLDPELVVITV